MLDGEVAIFDQAMRSRFDLLRQSDPTIIATPPIFMAFDVPYRAGQDLSLFPLRKRRKHLEEVIAGHDLVLPARRLVATDSKRGRRCLSAATRGTLGRMKRASTSAAKRRHGSR